VALLPLLVLDSAVAGWGGSTSDPSPAVVSVSTCTYLKGAKKLRVRTTVGRAPTTLSVLVEQPCFLTEPGLASSEEFVFFRLRCYRNSHSAGAVGTEDEAIDPLSDYKEKVKLSLCFN
jgi:hypothetical protein